jgi:hypothetical protein
MELLSIFEYFLTSKSFAAFREVSNDLCSVKEVSDKATINRCVTKISFFEETIYAEQYQDILTIFIPLLEKKME